MTIYTSNNSEYSSDEIFMFTTKGVYPQSDGSLAMAFDD